MKTKPAAPPLPATPEPATKAHEGTPHYADYGHPAGAPAPPAEAEAPADEASAGPPPPAGPDERATWASDDPRYAGGDPFDLSQEQSGL